MSKSPIIDNVGIGGTPFLTFRVSLNNGFTQDDLDDDLTACAVTGNNEVGKGNAGDKLLGRVVWVSSELVEGTTVPVLCAVQAQGEARFKYGSKHPPKLNGAILVDGDGRVIDASYYPNFLARGQVTAVDEAAQTCDVWLG